MPRLKDSKKIGSNILAAIIGVIAPALDNSCSSSTNKKVVQKINKSVDQPGKRILPKPTQKIGQDEANDPFVYITKTGKKYHREYCSSLRKSKKEIKSSEAKPRGYTPCSKCKPPRMLTDAGGIQWDCGRDCGSGKLFAIYHFPLLHPGNWSSSLNPLMRTKLPGTILIVRIRWRVGEQRRWTLVNYEDTKKANPGEQNIDNLYVNIGEFNKFDYYRMEWGNIQPWMQIHLIPTSMQKYRHGASQGYRLGFPERVRLLAPVMVDETLYLIGKSNLFEINLEHAMIETSKGSFATGFHR